jgi:hypothetical protein
MNQKNNLTIAVVVIIILAIVAIIALKSRNEEANIAPLNQTDIELNKAKEDDSMTSINANLDNISIEDTTGDDELEVVDKELMNL